ncbi:hypothetical protein B0G80_5596 [Paraburkholderia sp. BL6669N2]|uniref:hypothetical protein n=1 Tax=Paraburkholderia sp. BL6669N2 TaxID=1938807 RepID=UPI000E26CE5B|nr:hypothetical protein [Paraburkholderia sp. BL6669N2]REG49245.1 hypothetical protein B0G80_5596 [Paraburkholderia sp. BL6669N2]
MIKLLGILALAFGIAGCVAAQPPYYGYGDPPGYYAPRPSFGIGIGAGSFGGSGFGGAGVGLGF